MSALTRWWPAVATVSPSVNGRPSKLRLSASPNPAGGHCWRRGQRRRASPASKLPCALRRNRPTRPPALARWSPSRRRCRGLHRRHRANRARGGRTLPTISITSPSASPISVINLTAAARRRARCPPGQVCDLHAPHRRLRIRHLKSLNPFCPSVATPPTVSARRGSMWDERGTKKGRTFAVRP